MTLRFPYLTLQRRARIRAMRDAITTLARDRRCLEILKATPPENWGPLVAHHTDSKAQIQQDLFALAMTACKRGGYFVEFGAADGVAISNTWLLETKFGWTGILAEPARVRHAALRANRNCHIDTRCVWSGDSSHAATGGIPFTEHTSPDLSGVSAWMARRPRRSIDYRVETVSLDDLLESYAAPSHIDYLSIDTEGSEFEILNACDLGRWRFGTVTVEHNFLPQRDAIHDLLVAHGYKRILIHISEQDDWYVPA